MARCKSKSRWFFRSRVGIVCRMSGITFMVDSRGEKTAAVIDLRRHRKLWEDFYDTVLVESRAKEPRESLDSVKRRLKLTKVHG
jgi:hypothetical protein